MFIVEGNIGAGKSTFLKLAEKHLPYISIALEPVHNWQNQVFGQSLLANFYQNPQRWAYTLETLAMMHRAKDHITLAGSAGCSLAERSIYSGHYCFAHNSFESGYMDALEWSAYNEWFNFLVPGKCLPPQGFIYLKVDPVIAFDRIKKRNRISEKKITLKYLKQLELRHEEFLLEKNNVLPEIKDVPVLVLDCNEEFESDAFRLKELLDATHHFMSKQQPHLNTETAKVRHAY